MLTPTARAAARGTLAVACLATAMLMLEVAIVKTAIPHLDPRLAPIAPNGGPVPTALPLTDSPLLDSGSSICPAADARGVPRPKGAGCDIGAAELARRAPIATTGRASGASVNGTFDPGGQTAHVTTQYGPTSAYGVSAKRRDVRGWSPAPISTARADDGRIRRRAHPAPSRSWTATPRNRPIWPRGEGPRPDPTRYDDLRRAPLLRPPPLILYPSIAAHKETT